MARNATEETAPEITMHPDLASELHQLRGVANVNLDQVQKALAKRVKQLRGDALHAASAKVSKKLERV